jgi:hypothetical protein
VVSRTGQIREVMLRIPNRSVGLVVSGLLTAMCGNTDVDGPDEQERHGSETASETEGADSTDPKQDAGTGEACLGSISGRVLENGETEMVAVMVICIGPICLDPVVTEPDGRFTCITTLDAPDPCVYHDFNKERLHFEISAGSSPERYARYAFVRHPTQEDISDLGPEDFDLNLGTLSLFALPEEGATYDPELGVRVDLFGIGFELGPGGIVKRVIDDDEPIAHLQEIYVFRAPLDTWNPPFADTPLSALYFISPRWAKLADPGAPLLIEPPSGWMPADEGRLLLLGSYTSSYGDNAVRDRSSYIFRNADGECINTDETESFERIEDGELADCGSVMTTGGQLLTPPIPRFTWVGISR